MKVIVLYVILESLFICYTSAQCIIGRVLEESGLPMSYTNVVFINREDSAFIQGSVTKDDGTFAIVTDHSNGLLKVSSVGYVTRYVDARQGNVGDILMQPDTKTLSEVTVKGHRPAYRMTTEGLQANVEGTVLSKLGTGEDVLANVPGITKKQGNFDVFGKGTPLIYINGRIMRDASELDQLKSENIKSVELITNPGAKYDASVKAVVKIRTKTPQGEGFGFDLRSSYYQSENTDIVEQLNWNYRHNRLDVFGTFHYALDNGHYPSITNTLVKTDTIWKQHFLQDFHPQKQTFRNIIGSYYAFNDDNSLGFRYTVIMRPDYKTSSTVVSDITANDIFYDHLDNTLDTRSSFHPSHLLNVYFRGKIGNIGIDFNTDYLYNKTNGHTSYDEQSTDKQSRIVTSDNTERNELIASKLTVSHPLLGGELNVGAEYTHTKRNDDYINPEQYVPTSFAKLQEQHIAPFVEYSRQIPIGQFSAGLRYERVDFDYYENSLHLDEQSRSFGNLFPSLSFGTQIGKVQLQLGYSAKTRRPTYQQLSNNVTYGNRFLLQSGNPFLSHEYIHTLALMGVWKFLQFSVGYNDRRDAIIYWAEQQEENPAVSRITYINIPTLKSLVTNLSIAPKFGIWSPEFSVSMQKQWLTLHTDVATYKMNNPIFQFSLDNAFDFGHGWVASVNGWLTTKGNGDNTRLTRTESSVGVSITKLLLGDCLSIQAKGADLFHTEKTGTMLYAGAMQTEQISWRDTREFTLTIRYKFNSTRSKYKGTGAGNDEKKRL